jgi:PilZ domain-containing protein
MIRDAVLKVTRTIAEMRSSARKKYRLPMKVWFEPEVNTVNFVSPNLGIFLLGRTRDLSTTGISFFVPAIRIKEDYLVGQERVLNVEIDLAGRKVRMKVLGRRYEPTESQITEDKFVVGAQIIEMCNEDRRTYEHFMAHGNKIMKSVAASMEFGLD